VTTRSFCMLAAAIFALIALLQLKAGRPPQEIATSSARGFREFWRRRHLTGFKSVIQLGKKQTAQLFKAAV